MRTVMIYESHPTVLAGLTRRLEAVEGLRLLGAFTDPSEFAAAIARYNPDTAVVGSFGPGATNAANLADRSNARTRLLALVPGLRRNERVGFPRSIEIVRDGPRGDLLVQRLLRGRRKGHDRDVPKVTAIS